MRLIATFAERKATIAMTTGQIADILQSRGDLDAACFLNPAVEFSKSFCAILPRFFRARAKREVR